MRIQLIDSDGNPFSSTRPLVTGEIEFDPNQTGEEKRIVSYRLIAETTFEEIFLKNIDMPIPLKQMKRIPSSKAHLNVPVLRLKVNFGKCSFNED